MGRKQWPAPSLKRMRLTRSAPTTSPTRHVRKRILRQQQAPRRPQPPLRLRDPRLNELATDPLSLLAYDAFILESGKEPDDSARETGSTEPGDDEPPTGDDPL